MKFLLSLVLAFLITGETVVARADDSYLSRQTLKGLKEISVLVEDIVPEVERAGLTRALIQTDVELKLRLAGIPVLVGLAGLGAPHLYVQVSVLPSPEIDYWPFYSFVALVQSAALDRDRSILYSLISWDVGSIGGVGKDKVAQIRDNVKDQVDTFINAYLSVNPK